MIRSAAIDYLKLAIAQFAAIRILAFLSNTFYNRLQSEAGIELTEITTSCGF
jgi:hypothetical protein